MKRVEDIHEKLGLSRDEIYADFEKANKAYQEKLRHERTLAVSFCAVCVLGFVAYAELFQEKNTFLGLCLGLPVAAIVIGWLYSGSRGV